MEGLFKATVKVYRNAGIPKPDSLKTGIPFELRAEPVILEDRRGQVHTCDPATDEGQLSLFYDNEAVGIITFDAARDRMAEIVKLDDTSNKYFIMLYYHGPFDNKLWYWWMHERTIQVVEPHQPLPCTIPYQPFYARTWIYDDSDLPASKGFWNSVSIDCELRAEPVTLTSKYTGHTHTYRPDSKSELVLFYRDKPIGFINFHAKRDCIAEIVRTNDDPRIHYGIKLYYLGELENGCKRFETKWGQVVTWRTKGNSPKKRGTPREDEGAGAKS